MDSIDPTSRWNPIARALPSTGRGVDSSLNKICGCCGKSNVRIRVVEGVLRKDARLKRLTSVGSMDDCPSWVVLQHMLNAQVAGASADSVHLFWSRLDLSRRVGSTNAAISGRSRVIWRTRDSSVRSRCNSTSSHSRGRCSDAPGRGLAGTGSGRLTSRPSRSAIQAATSSEFQPDACTPIFVGLGKVPSAAIW